MKTTYTKIFTLLMYLLLTAYNFLFFSCSNSGLSTGDLLSSPSNSTNSESSTPTSLISKSDTIYANPAVISQSSFATLYWNIDNVSKVEIAGLGDVTLKSSYTIKPTQSTTYTFKITKKDSSTYTKDVTVVVNTTGSTVVYPGYTYNLPIVRPFISLKDYGNISKSSNEYTRFKNYVDSAVTIIQGLASNVTWQQAENQIQPSHYAFSISDLDIMYSITQDTKYIQSAIRLTDLYIDSENLLIASGGAASAQYDSYLYIGENLQNVSLTYDHGNNLLTSTQKSKWETYAKKCLNNLWGDPSKASWGGKIFPWSGWATNDPGNNYYFSFLKATMLWALASQDMTWINFLQQKKFNQLVSYYSSLPGGGSREGTGYGTAQGSLFENYRYWKSSTSEDLSTITSHARETIEYWVHATVPTFDYFAPIGDQARSSMPSMYDYQRNLMLEAVALNVGTTEASHGTYWLNRTNINGSIAQLTSGFNLHRDLLKGSQAEVKPTNLVYQSTGAGTLFARSSWDSTASWLSVVAGPYDQSHAHQEQGHFNFYKGSWLTATSNMYSHSGIHQEVNVNNIIRFENNGSTVPQSMNTSAMTYNDSNGVLNVSAILAPAYTENSTLIKSWTRSIKYDRSQHLIKVHDVCVVGSTVKPIFQLNVKEVPTISGNVITTSKVKITQVYPSVVSCNAPKIINLKNIDSSEFTEDTYRLELTGDGCEFIVDVQAL